MNERDADVTRRGFVQSLGLGLGTSLVSTSLSQADQEYDPTGDSVPNEFDFRKGSAALQADRVVKSACQFCNSLCGLKVSLKHGRIIAVEGETQDPVQSGGLCVKADMMTELVYNPLRLKTPLKRIGGIKGETDSRFEAISWEEALTIIAGKFLRLRDQGLAHTIANRTTGRMPRGTDALIARFFALLGSPNNTDVGPVCNDAGGNALSATFGLGNFTNGYGIDPATGNEDLGQAKFLLMLGTNQAETHPVTFAHVLRCREQVGAKLVVVDPRKTPTAEYADTWLAPKPHTDMALVLGMLSEIIENNLYDRDFVAQWVIGFEELKAHLREHEYTVEWAARQCDISAKSLRELAQEFATNKPAAIYCNAGISHQMGAFDTYRVLAFLSAITGNIGIPGGGCNFMHNTWPGGMNLPPLEVETPNKREALPVGPDWFAEAILEAGPYPLGAIVTEGNPLISSANTNKVKEAFRRLDFYVYTGLFMEEAAYYADVILPVCSGFEMETVYMRRDDRGIRWQDQVVDPVGESQPDWKIWIELAHVMEELDESNPTGYWAAAFPKRWLEYGNLWAEFVKHTPGMAGMTEHRMRQRNEPLRWPCPHPHHPGVSTMYHDHPSWYEAVAAVAPDRRDARFLTPSGKVELYTPELEAKLVQSGHSALPRYYTHQEVTGNHPRLQQTGKLISNPIHPHALTPAMALTEATANTRSREFPLMGMIGRPSVVHFASVTQWTMSGKRLNGERFIQIHPKTAKANNIDDGDTIIVESPRGSITGTALYWNGIREDTVFVPNTFGPDQQLADPYGLPRYEAANILIDDQQFDNLSGQQAYKCFACRVESAVRLQER